MKSNIETNNVPIEDVEQKELHGRCKFFDVPKGWGIIKGEDDKEYFFHVTNTLEHISSGRRVIFILGHSKNKANSLEAIEVKLDKTITINNQEHYGTSNKQ